VEEANSFNFPHGQVGVFAEEPACGAARFRPGVSMYAGGNDDPRSRVGFETAARPNRRPL